MKAFPYVREVPSDQAGYKAYAHEDGMDLRDYFAAKTLQGFLSAPDTGWSFDELAEKCYLMADAMMKAREVNHD